MPFAEGSAAEWQEAQTKWTIEGVLGMMDKAAQDFHTLTADLEHVKYTAVVKDTFTETGHIFVRRDEKMRIDVTKPDPRTILRTGDNLFVFNPKINRVEEYNLGKNRQMVDQYVLLGFGTKGENIKKGYLVSVVGEEDLDSKKTIVLELTPKSERVRKNYNRMILWIDPDKGISVQQEFLTPQGDYRLCKYSSIKLNEKIDTDVFKLKTTGKTQTLSPRG